MKLVIISNYGLNSDGGGVKVYTQNLVKTLQKRLSVTLLIREGIPTEIEQKLPRNKLLYTALALKKLNEIQPEFVLSQGGWFAAIPAMLHKSKHPDVRIIYLYHTHYDSPKTIKDKIKRTIEKYLMTFVLSRFDLVLFVSRALKENVETNSRTKILSKWGVLYGAPNTKFPQQDEIEEFKRKFRINRHRIYLLGHGLTALEVKKEGAKILIHTLKNSRDKHLALILTRRGRFTDELKGYAEKLGVKDKVIFTGDLENPHVATLCADIYTHITHGEGGLSLALLEVMDIGKPIVASSVGGIPEAIRHPLEGILVENGINQIVAAVKHLTENPKLQKKMSVISREAVKRRFSWEKTAERLLNSFFSCK
ncbi:glycosyltransferase family 4 protein [Thermococcus waiotapuensis]|uniref:Glycosyltransferase family 4 protein n=1 Tax=Thermococcus waiotapuensis TaxID=90909 RepID=A0AAE4NVV2_9EURY|nr:glycosyltransferase family 4 protein [Thermococcus waiotapuensis]MDV3104089.1 glycosyltransferase family 4 protein [Thermococcus waiotapuensis]